MSPSGLGCSRYDSGSRKGGRGWRTVLLKNRISVWLQWEGKGGAGEEAGGWQGLSADRRQRGEEEGGRGQDRHKARGRGDGSQAPGMVQERGRERRQGSRPSALCLRPPGTCWPLASPPHAHREGGEGAEKEEGMGRKKGGRKELRCPWGVKEKEARQTGKGNKKIKLERESEGQSGTGPSTLTQHLSLKKLRVSKGQMCLGQACLLLRRPCLQAPSPARPAPEARDRG